MWNNLQAFLNSTIFVFPLHHLKYQTNLLIKLKSSGIKLLSMSPNLFHNFHLLLKENHEIFNHWDINQIALNWNPIVQYHLQHMDSKFTESILFIVFEHDCLLYNQKNTSHRYSKSSVPSTNYYSCLTTEQRDVCNLLKNSYSPYLIDDVLPFLPLPHHSNCLMM